MRARSYLSGLVLLPAAVLCCSTTKSTLDGGGGDSGGPANPDIAVCSPDAGPHSLVIDNRYLPMPVGRKLVLEGREGSSEVHLEITVLDQVERVAGVDCRVVEERESKDGKLVEVSRNFFVQAPDGTVCYYGEDVDIYRDGAVVGHEGAWRAGEGQNRPGIMMPANPRVGMKYPNEVAPGVAEDTAEITAMGTSVDVPAGHFEGALEITETSPLDSGSSHKVYVPDIGIVVDDELRLVGREGP
ncbi:MAG: hypothetical protein D6806_11715 [Deltaproteobacteria bacterium]|nr:MAG: hypothetical protein D6806_11715 [Deltaproteobacteria bacterium]